VSIGFRRQATGRAALLALLASLAAPAQAAPKSYRVVIDQLAFGPVPAGLRVGDTIEWVNRDILQHTATARDHSFDVDLAPQAKARIRLTKAGVIAFYCRYHPGMTGKLSIAR
jgi:plastocyanin